MAHRLKAAKPVSAIACQRPRPFGTKRSLYKSLIQPKAFLEVRRVIKSLFSATGYRIERTRPRRGDSMPTRSGLASLKDADDLRFRIGDWHYEVFLQELVGRPCFGYAPDSWHPYVATVRELVDDASLRYRDSVLRLHFERWQPSSIAAAHFPNGELSNTVLSQIPARTLFEPWLKEAPPCDDPFNPKCHRSGAPLFGPLTPAQGQSAFSRLQKMLQSVQKFGYRPDAFPRGLIGIVVLRHRGKERYLVGHGQHRAAVLAALGHVTIEVGIHRTLPKVIDSAEADHWPHVSSGLIPKEIAVRQLERYFPSGTERDPALKVARQVLHSRPPNPRSSINEGESTKDSLG